MGRATNVNLNYGTTNILLAVEGIIQEAKKDIQTHVQHKTDGGAMGLRHYCKLCQSELQREDEVKVYEVAGNKAVFTEDELNQKFSSPTGIRLMGLTHEQIPEYQIKKCYSLGVGTDKKMEKQNRINYELLVNKLKRTGGSFVVEAKLNSRGIKGGDLAVIRYSPEYNRLMLVELFYSEDIKAIEKVVSPQLPEDKLALVADKLFSNLEEMKVSDIQETQAKKFFGEVQRRLENPTATATEPEMSEDEKLLVNML